ncbi:hypothetical protein [Streptomyces sp. G-G2]|uniref:hypothetical protein n=1 Tax=Streptomyces sp. G-G2 TaxID=3046201 RepID=UPI0024BAE771|nr:hypothetical protein [Streptomyces sp. G-G2]MDJ0383216.1 hypothetical protein [Streptomyces sp. G-G2]
MFVNEGTFGILDDGEVPIETIDWSHGIIAPMSNGALVLTGINTGNVQVQVESGSTATPSADNELWEETGRCRIWAPRGKLHIESLVNGPHQDLPPLSIAGPGWYEVEVKARGRHLNPDGASLEPSECYLIQARPDTNAPPPITRAAPVPARDDEETRRQRLLRGL